MIKKSEFAGFCFGVKRASELINSYIGSTNKKIYTLGELIHNDDFNNELIEKGVTILQSFEEIKSLSPKDSLIFIRAHGATKTVYEYLNSHGFEYIDTTCPFVENIHKIVTNEKEKDNPFFVIIGDRTHPEILSICSYIGGKENYDYITAVNSEELQNRLQYIPQDSQKRKVIIAQTTQNVNEWKISSEIIKKLYTNTTFFDTICVVTQKRQKDAVEISKEVDLMIVVGGKKSSNTKKLCELSSQNCDTFMIANAVELKPEMLFGKNNIGITAGASTPDGIIQEVINKMAEIKTNENTNEKVVLSDEMSFEEMLEKSFRTLNTGDKVIGVITSVTPTEIDLDLGIKHTAILKYDDVTDDPDVNLLDEFKVGDEIKVQLMKFNDAEGTVQVSKKRVDSLVNWEKVEEAYNSQQIIEGKVVDMVKSGVIVFWNSVRIFIPASQTGISKDGDLSQLNGNVVRFKLIEVDSSKRRAVGSIRVVNREEKKALADKFWSEIEVGKTYTGKVKSMTNYGAFVDLGGIDGMVHVTELSWLRIKHPSEVVSIGDELTVFVKEFDAEKNRISLGYKTAETNPWKLFTDTYSVGDVAKAKIVNMMPFGAFAQILPGVDGLIHISQISNEKISKPADVLQLGQEVDVKIIDVDTEAQRISLSMKALIEDVAEENADTEVDEGTTDAE